MPEENQSNEIKIANDDSAAAAKDAAQQAAAKAKVAAADATKIFTKLPQRMQIYLGALVVVVFSCVLFDMVSFKVGAEGAVTPGQASTMKKAQSYLNSISYSAFQSTFWGKLLVLSAISGIGIFVWSNLKKRSEPWIPLALAGSSTLCVLMLVLVRVTGIPDFPSGYYTGTEAGTTLLGWWLPFAAAAAATFVSVQHILRA